MRRRFLLFFTMHVTLALTAQRPERYAYPPVHGCGLTAKALFDGKALSDLPAAMRETVRRLIKSQIQSLPGNMGIDKRNLDLQNTLFISELLPVASEHSFYAAWWENNVVCGMHENCPVWILEKNAVRIKLVQPPLATQIAGTAQLQTGWAAGLQVQPDGSQLLLLISSGYCPHGGGKRVATCERLHGGKLIRTECSASCDMNTELEKSEQGTR
jgi:hypothetical protein